MSDVHLTPNISNGIGSWYFTALQLQVMFVHDNMALGVVAKKVNVSCSTALLQT